MMSKKTISISLSKDSIKAAIKEIEKYKQEFQRKNDLFVQKCAEIGINVIHTVMQGVDLGEDEWSYSAESITENSGSLATEKIVLSGRRILYVEFGAGVIHSQPQNPKAKEMGYGVGTNSPGGWAWNMTKFGGGWFYRKNGESIHSYGNPAYMPLYKSSVEIRQRMNQIAKEVFGN